MLAGMLVLLGAVAALQYRWTNQASNANEMRIRAELESLMMKWEGDLYSDLSAKDRYMLPPLHVSHMLDILRRNLSALLAKEGFMLEENIQPDLPRVMGDMFAVCGCLENLITNAVKYGGADRGIYLAAKLHTLSEGDQEVAISVEDHGMGIPASELKHIFEPFYRSPEAAAAQIHGTGLGLSLAKHLAEAMGGRLTVVGEVGSGSIFTLHLQLSPGQNHDVSTEHSHAAAR